MKNIDIKRKLVVSFTTLTIFIILLSFLSAFFLFSVNEENNKLYSHPFTISNTIKDIEIDIRLLYSDMQEIMQPANADSVDEIVASISETEDDISEKFIILEEYYLGDMEDVELLEYYYLQSITQRDIVIALIEDGDYINAAIEKDVIGTAIKTQILEETSKITLFAEAKAIELRESVEFHTRNYFITTISVATVLIVLIVVGFSVLVRDIFPPIKKLVETIESYEKGEGKNTLALDRGDEIGVVANALNSMLHYIKTQSELTELSLKLDNVKNQELLRITLLSIGEAVITTDLNSIISEINPVAEELTGYSREEAIGMHSEDVFKIVHGSTKLKLLNPIPQAIQSKSRQEQKHKTILVSKSKEEYAISSSVAPISDENGETFGVVLVFRDISIEVEKQEKIHFLSQHDSLTKLKNH